MRNGLWLGWLVAALPLATGIGGRRPRIAESRLAGSLRAQARDWCAALCSERQRRDGVPIRPDEAMTARPFQALDTARQIGLCAL